MPGYFFHVRLEVPVDKNPDSSTLADCVKALEPFGKSNDTSWASTGHKKPAGKHASHKVIKHDEKSAALEFRSTSAEDSRFNQVFIDTANMTNMDEDIVDRGIGTDISGQHMKAKYQKLSLDSCQAEYGIVHLYRDVDETAGLYKESPLRSSDLYSETPAHKSERSIRHPAPPDEECTNLCILAVPSYMTPSDLLAFVGEKTRNDVTHFRMIRTARANRYMVLMKFKLGKTARAWQEEWNGKIFNPMEPETCHVVFLKSVELVKTSADGKSYVNDGLSIPTINNESFLSSKATSRPLAPRTSALVELPTCPVCLERMDETTGLLTIPCQHVFHCTCLQKWSGGGCPVCRYCSDDFSSGPSSAKKKIKMSDNQPFDGEELLCQECQGDKELWQCLICAYVGCGRYQQKDAFKHYEKTGHIFSMHLETQRVWDYQSDSYVHRIIQQAANGEKLVEMPGRRQDITALEGREDLDMAKMENVAFEYTHLLTSQLESQRSYYENQFIIAANKAKEATTSAEKATAEAKRDAAEAQEAKTALKVLDAEKHDLVAREAEKDSELARLRKKNQEWQVKHQNIHSKLQQEQNISEGMKKMIDGLEKTKIPELVAKISALELKRQDLQGQIDSLEAANLIQEEDKQQVHSQVNGQLQAMIQQGQISQSDLDGATIRIGAQPEEKLSLRDDMRRRMGLPYGSKKNLEGKKIDSQASPLDSSLPNSPLPKTGDKLTWPSSSSQEPTELDAGDLQDATSENYHLIQASVQWVENMNRMTTGGRLRYKPGADPLLIKKYFQSQQESMISAGLLEEVSSEDWTNLNALADVATRGAEQGTSMPSGAIQPIVNDEDDSDETVDGIVVGGVGDAPKKKRKNRKKKGKK